MKINRIGIDGFNLAMPKGSGIATYAFNLNLAVRALGHRSQILFGPDHSPGGDALFNEVALFDASPPPSASRRMASFLRNPFRAYSPLKREATLVAPTGEVITRQIARAAPACDGFWVARDVFHGANRAHGVTGQFTALTFDEASGPAPDVMHWTCALPLRAPGRPNLYTLHDMIPFRLPFTTLDNKARSLSLCREIAATADRIVTVSEHSKADIVRILGIDEARVTVTYQSVDMPAALTARPDEDVAREVEGVFGLPWRGYFLFFGAIEPKKNLARVIEAYLGAGVAAPLVIIGGKAWLEADETRLLYPDLVQGGTLKDGALRRSDRVRVYDYLPFSLLVSVIRGARATLLPSLYEGFGLPVLESMLLGTPVLSSTEGALPEIAGDAAVLVDPYDVQAIRRAIIAVDADEDLRAELTRRGRLQAEKFSPEAYGRRLAALYESLG